MRRAATGRERLATIKVEGGVWLMFGRTDVFASCSAPEAAGGTSAEDGRFGKRSVRNADIGGV